MKIKVKAENGFVMYYTNATSLVEFLQTVNEQKTRPPQVGDKIKLGCKI